MVRKIKLISILPNVVRQLVRQLQKRLSLHWRSDLVEVLGKDEQEIEIKEKKVKNKVVIDPKLKLESVADDLVLL